MYSFCESVHAVSLGRWHIRKLTKQGRKLGGGIDTPSLCGRVKEGWDLDVGLRKSHLKHACQDCLAEYNRLTPYLTQKIWTCVSCGWVNHKRQCGNCKRSQGAEQKNMTWIDEPRRNNASELNAGHHRESYNRGYERQGVQTWPDGTSW